MRSKWFVMGIAVLLVALAMFLLPGVTGACTGSSGGSDPCPDSVVIWPLK
jgi:hypothetical protein